MLVCAALVGIERFCYVQTAGFRLGKIHSDFVYQPASVGSQEKPDVLSQPFTFLGSGVQCYAFLSEDRTTVLKVFKHYHNMPITSFWKEVPLPPLFQRWRAHILERRRARLHSIFSSCELAYREYKEETGLLFLHLNPTSTLNQKLILIDKLGIAHRIDLDQTSFILQKKVEMFSEKMESLRKKNDTAGMRACLDSLTTLIQNRCEKGIENSDLRLERNIGFIGTQAIEIDLGSFHKISDEERKREQKRELRELKQFIKQNYAEHEKDF